MSFYISLQTPSFECDFIYKVKKAPDRMCSCCVQIGPFKTKKEAKNAWILLGRKNLK